MITRGFGSPTRIITRGFGGLVVKRIITFLSKFYKRITFK